VFRQYAADTQRTGRQRRRHRNPNPFVSASRSQYQPRQRRPADGPTGRRAPRLPRVRRPVGDRRPSRRDRTGPGDRPDGGGVGQDARLFHAGSASVRRHVSAGDRHSMRLVQ